MTVSIRAMQEHAEREWKFARAKIVFAGFVQAIPVPLNVLSIPSRYCCVSPPLIYMTMAYINDFVARLLFLITFQHAKQSPNRKVCYDINYLAKVTWANGQLVEQVQRHWDEEKAGQTATKSDVETLVSSLDKVCFFVSCMDSGRLLFWSP